MLMTLYTVLATDIFQGTAWLSFLHSAFGAVCYDTVLENENIT